MFYGALLLKLIGTFVRWIFLGFSRPFKEVWQGPADDKDFTSSAGYEIISNVIGFITLFAFCSFIMWTGC